MAENKKSFIAYSDWEGMFKALPDEIAGKLIKHIFSYVNDQNPQSDDFVINALFEQIKATLKRDLVKWEGQREQRSLAGKKSAEQRATKTNERSTVVNETERNSTVSVSDSVISKDINISKHEIFKNECLQSQQWLETIAMNIKIPLDKIQFALAEFNSHLIMDGEIKQDLKDYKNHFTRWSRKVKEIKKA